jgi:hypothetical protein
LDRTYWQKARLFACLAFASVAGFACGSDDPAPTSSESPSTDDDEKDAGTPRAMECSEEGEQRACSCSGGGAGKKTCKNGKYGNCTNCVTARSDAGARPAAGNPMCRAGYYTGGFTGKYKPGAFGFGIGTSLLEVDIMGAMSNGRPALDMTLEENVMGNGGEFTTFTVGNGCMTGVAMAVGTNNPFVARLTGDLDCSTGQFIGTLEGKYTLLDLMGLEFKFKGPLTAQFDVDSSSLEDGEWTVDEPPALTGDPAGGGVGTWNASFESDTAPKRDVDPCASLDITDADGGVIARDAGAP